MQKIIWLYFNCELQDKNNSSIVNLVVVFETLNISASQGALICSWIVVDNLYFHFESVHFP